MHPRTVRTIALLAAMLPGLSADAVEGDRWTPEEAHAWAERTPWLVGCNYAPSSAINQLEMWQAATFDPETIDRELGWAEDLGFTSIRVFLHHLLWQEDSEGFLDRVDQFLTIADRHKIGVMFVLFDAVWDPDPQLGPQRAPTPGLHNSGWVQSPGSKILADPARHDELRAYVEGVVSRFREDPRVHAWDLFNEPDNPNRNSYGAQEPADKPALALALLKKTFEWCRIVDPEQPLTAGVWRGEWAGDGVSEIDRFMLDHSDVISFHIYADLDETRRRIDQLEPLGRPLLCTEYMARPAGSTFDPILGEFKAKGVGAYNWGFVSGKSQTIYPWDSWKSPYDAEPPVWFHDIFRADGTAYSEGEVAYIRNLTAGVGR